MAQNLDVFDHGIECLKKAAIVPDTNYPTRYSFRMTSSGGGSLITDYSVVDQIDTTPFLDLSSTNIPASSSTPVTIVASLAADVRKLIIVENIGEYIGLYSDPSGTPVLEAILPLGGGEFDIELSAGDEIGLRHMKNTAITNYYIAINFLG